MGKGFQGAVLRALGAKEHVVTVSGRDRLAEHFVRIHFRSGTLLGDGDLHPDSWIRLWFPNPDNPSTLNQRGYTLVDPDPQAGTFAIDFVLHHPMGPASYWASRCETGEELVAKAQCPGRAGTARTGMETRVSKRVLAKRRSAHVIVSSTLRAV